MRYDKTINSHYLAYTFHFTVSGLENLLFELGSERVPRRVSFLFAKFSEATPRGRNKRAVPYALFLDVPDSSACKPTLTTWKSVADGGQGAFVLTILDKVAAIAS